MKWFKGNNHKVIWRFMAMALTAALLLQGFSAVAAAETNEHPKLQYEDPARYSNHELMLRFGEEYRNQTEANRKMLSRIKGLKIEDYFDGYALVSLDSQAQVKNALEYLKHEKTVEYVQPNYRYTAKGDPSLEAEFSKQWGLHNDGTFTPKTEYSQLVYKNRSAVAGADIHAKEAWDFYSDSSKEVVVAILDTGVDITHPDLKNVIWSNSDETPDGRDNDNNGYIDDLNGWNFYNNSNDLMQGQAGDNDHGTHVAGIIAAEANGIGIAGTASNINVKIMPLKVLGGADGSGETRSIVKALLYAESKGAVICNFSLSENYYDILLKAAIEDSSMLVVAAAGNGVQGTQGRGYNIDDYPSYPSSFALDNTISVANICWDGTLALSSCYGTISVDVAAPGSDIYSTITGGGYEYYTGTSMAAPAVSGSAAVIYAYYGGLTARQMKDILIATVSRYPDLDNRVKSGGVINLYTALTSPEAAKLADKIKPVIRADVKAAGTYKKNLSVSVTDKGENLNQVYYAKGKQREDYFTSKKGISIPVKNGAASKSISVSQSETYTIYAVDSAGNATMLVKNVTIKTIALNAAGQTLRVGQTYTVKGRILPASENGKITYTSSDPKVARVNTSTGSIKALKKGKARITANVKGGKPAVLNITVK